MRAIAVVSLLLVAAVLLVECKPVPKSRAKSHEKLRDHTKNVAKGKSKQVLRPSAGSSKAVKKQHKMQAQLASLMLDLEKHDKKMDTYKHKTSKQGTLDVEYVHKMEEKMEQMTKTVESLRLQIAQLEKAEKVRKQAKPAHKLAEETEKKENKESPKEEKKAPVKKEETEKKEAAPVKKEEKKEATPVKKEEKKEETPAKEEKKAHAMEEEDDDNYDLEESDSNQLEEDDSDSNRLEESDSNRLEESESESDSEASDAHEKVDAKDEDDDYEIDEDPKAGDNNDLEEEDDDDDESPKKVREIPQTSSRTASSPTDADNEDVDGGIMDTLTGYLPENPLKGFFGEEDSQYKDDAAALEERPATGSLDDADDSWF